VDEASDLALLKAAGKFSALPVADSRKVKLGSPVMTVGFPEPPLLGFSAKFSKGDIAALAGVYDEPVNFQISVPIQPGNSGGALLDGCGNVVGIVSQGIDKKQALDCNGNVLENVNYAVKSQYLLRLLESIPEIAPKLKPPGTEEKKAEGIATSAEMASVMILIYGMKL
jgi:S1-C subfamily serine protease